MKKLLWLLTLLASTAWADSYSVSGGVKIVTSPISASLTCNRSTGVAPLGVICHTVGTTDPTVTSEAFREIQYTWTFGDPNVTPAGTCGTNVVAGEGFWRCGVQPGVLSKNQHMGPIAGHVYENPGSYQICMTAYDGTNTSPQQCQTITVTSAASQWSTNKTICFSTSALSSGCDAGATYVGNVTDLATSIAANIGSGNVRLLLKRGDTFPTVSAYITAPGPLMIGAFGSGALPIISRTTQGITALNFGVGSGDVRLMDVEIVGASTSSTDGGGCVTISGDVGRATILRLTCHDIGKGIIMSGYNTLYESIIQDSNIYNIGASSGGVGIYGAAYWNAYLGNSVGPMFSTGEHVMRMQPGRLSSLSYNSATTPGDSGKAVFTLRAAEHFVDMLVGLHKFGEDSQYVAISDNKFSGGGTSYAMFHIGPAGDTQNHWLYDIVAERNWITSNVFAGGQAMVGLGIQAQRVTVRNNVCDVSNASQNRSCYSIGTRNLAGAPYNAEHRLYNNTCYSSDASGAGPSFACIELTTSIGTVTNVTLKNNLAYAPAYTTPRLLNVAGTVSGTIGASGTFGNSSDAQVKNTNPFTSVAPFTPTNAKPSAGSYAVGTNNACTGAPCSISTGVPVWSDFFMTAEPATRDIGAVIH